MPGQVEAAEVLDRGRPSIRALGLTDKKPIRKKSIRKTAAVLAGKATGALSRASGRGGGTTLPGDVARAIDPRVLTKLASDLTHGSVIIHGPNSKTTTLRP